MESRRGGEEGGKHQWTMELPDNFDLETYKS